MLGLYISKQVSTNDRKNFNWHKKEIKVILNIESKAIRFLSYLSFSHRRKIDWRGYNILYTIVHSLHYFEWTSAVVHFSSTLTHIPFLDGHLRYSTSFESLLLWPTFHQRHCKVFQLGDNLNCNQYLLSIHVFCELDWSIFRWFWSIQRGINLWNIIA